MKSLLITYSAYATAILLASCSNPNKSKLKGNWRSKDGTVKLQVTDKQFTTNDGEAITEDYFVKGDSLYTSFQGNQPYTVFLIQKLDDHNLKLMGPDSVAVEYTR